jgi:hypothetical protein
MSGAAILAENTSSVFLLAWCRSGQHRGPGRTGLAYRREELRRGNRRIDAAMSEAGNDTIT